nr:hypothetical protein [Tessaracoccus coleopterorum]
MFFAFAGYARIATMGEEVRDPARSIPRAILLALGSVLALYAVVGSACSCCWGRRRWRPRPLRLRCWPPTDPRPWLWSPSRRRPPPGAPCSP